MRAAAAWSLNRFSCTRGSARFRQPRSPFAAAKRGPAVPGAPLLPGHGAQPAPELLERRDKGLHRPRRGQQGSRSGDAAEQPTPRKALPIPTAGARQQSRTRIPCTGCGTAARRPGGRPGARHARAQPRRSRRTPAPRSPRPRPRIPPGRRTCTHAPWTARGAFCARAPPAPPQRPHSAGTRAASGALLVRCWRVPVNKSAHEPVVRGKVELKSVGVWEWSGAEAPTF